LTSGEVLHLRDIATYKSVLTPKKAVESKKSKEPITALSIEATVGATGAEIKKIPPETAEDAIVGPESARNQTPPPEKAEEVAEYEVRVSEFSRI